MKKLLLLGLMLMVPVLCHASGYALYEMNAGAHGMAHAYICRVNDASAVWYNPAALTRIESNDVYASGTYISAGGDFLPTIQPGLIDQESRQFFPINLYYGRRISDNWAFGFGVYTPFGLGTEWPQNSLPAFVSQKATLRTFFITPSIAYKISPMLSIGGGIDIAYGDVKLRRNIQVPAPLPQAIISNDIDADTVDVGFNLAALIETDNNFSFAVTYKHKIDLKLDGDARFQNVPAPLVPFFPDGPAFTELPLPAQLMFGASTTYENFSFEGDLIFSFWDAFESLPISFANQTLVVRDQVIPRDWENTWAIRLGVEYKWDDRNAFRGGYLWDKTPVVDQSVDPILPDGSRNGITLGYGYNTGVWKFDVSYMHLFIGDRTSPIDNFISPPGNLAAAGFYTSSADLLAFGFGYKF
jgi:long-chain fatty acid transport protein